MQLNEFWGKNPTLIPELLIVAACIPKGQVKRGTMDMLPELLMGIWKNAKNFFFLVGGIDQKFKKKIFGQNHYTLPLRQVWRPISN